MEKSNSKIEKPITYKKSFSQKLHRRTHQKGNTGKIRKQHFNIQQVYFL